MIHFECRCGKKYEVPEQYAGKKVRCKKCNNTVRVPSKEKEDLSLVTPVSIESQSISSSCIQSDEPADSDNNGLPKPLIYAFIALGIFLIGVLLYVFVLRDTWELDNSQLITQMIRDAKQHYGYEEYDKGLKKYDELVSFVGDRELKREILKADYSDVCQKYEVYKGFLIKEKARIAREKAEAERRKKEAELARIKQKEEEVVKQEDMLNPTFLTPSNVRELSPSIKKDKCFQFIIWPPGHGNVWKDFQGPNGSGIYSLYISYFVVQSAFINEKNFSDLEYSGRHNLLNHIKDLSDDNNKFEFDIALYFENGTFSDKAKNYNSSTMLLYLPITKDEMFNLIDGFGQKPYKPALVKCKIAEVDTITYETNRLLHEKRQLCRLGGIQFKAEAYSLEIVELNHPAVKICSAEIAAIKDNQEVSNKEIEQKYQVEADRLAQIRQAQLKTENEKRLQEQLKLPHAVVENIINRCNAFRSAKFTGTKNMGNEVSYDYEVECVTQGGLIRLGTFNVAIMNGKCREVYYNGTELWSTMICTGFDYTTP